MGSVVAFVLLALLTTVFGIFSITLALVTGDINSFAAPINGMNLPLLLLSGVLLPLTLAPYWMRVLAHFNPLYYVVEGTRVLATGTVNDGKVRLAFAVMIPSTAIVSLWATRVYRTAVSRDPPEEVRYVRTKPCPSI
ncbi:MAG: hypothetical protein A2W01_08710 [Candidatus Solincola sediminis]|uniref:ABC-2 type transporter transmembrane domain-containing protein n=1 Tax=Candidatus Solincola sediminis TaxID=1797199 RepID=A0A1F2WSW9_9ACTN|nr:MAG: hypothetical protein A2Y75_07775 [Candidatus Solincola sediminis]OFW60210.1 MAG: hypothetical protein A2W01_08710 [Candidatus Solincola sediminis]